MLDTSLRHLDMDYVDLYLVHSWDNNTPIFEIMEGLNDAVKAGKVRAIGISNQRETSLMWDSETGMPVCHAVVWQCARAAEICRTSGDFRADGCH